MKLAINDSRIVDYVSTYIHTGEKFIYKEDSFYVALTELEITPTNSDELVILFLVYMSGYHNGYHDGY